MGDLGIFYANQTSICLDQHINNKGEIGTV